MKRLALLVTLLAGCGSDSLSTAPITPQSPGPWVGSADKPLAVFVLGTHHYDPQKTLPGLAAELEKYGFRTRVVSTDYDPEHNPQGVPGISALAKADVAVLFMRFLTLPRPQINALYSYLDSGKPIVAIRTTTHAFDFPAGDPLANWNDFGKNVCGTRYIAHVGKATEVSIASGAADHPILRGFPRDPFTVPTQLYLADLPADAVPLVMGAATEEKRFQVSQFGWVKYKPMNVEPIAWTWQHPGRGRVFTTTFGSVADFENPAVRRLIINGIHWAVKMPVPAK